MGRFVIIVNGFQQLTIITKHSILDVAAALDLPLKDYSKSTPTKHLPVQSQEENTRKSSGFFTFNLEHILYIFLAFL